MFKGKNASITYLGKMFWKLQKNPPESTSDAILHTSGRQFYALKVPNSRSEDDNNHLFISESIQTPVWKNKKHRIDSKTQSLRAFLQMGEQRGNRRKSSIK